MPADQKLVREGAAPREWRGGRGARARIACRRTAAWCSDAFAFGQWRGVAVLVHELLVVVLRLAVQRRLCFRARAMLRFSDGSKASAFAWGVIKSGTS